MVSGVGVGWRFEAFGTHPFLYVPLVMTLLFDLLPLLDVFSVAYLAFPSSRGETSAPSFHLKEEASPGPSWTVGWALRSLNLVGAAL